MNGEMNRTSDNMQMVTVCNVPASSSSCSTDSLEIFLENENGRLGHTMANNGKGSETSQL
jgi:hypothetical protein